MNTALKIGLGATGIVASAAAVVTLDQVCVREDVNFTDVYQGNSPSQGWEGMPLLVFDPNIADRRTGGPAHSLVSDAKDVYGQALEIGKEYHVQGSQSFLGSSITITPVQTVKGYESK